MSARLSPVSAIVRNELRALTRERTFTMLLGIFLAMTFFSVYIGWSTRTTTNAIYRASVAYLGTQGATHVPPNPLSGVSPLLIFDNMLIYILLVGALLAIVIGHRSFIRERKAGVLPLIFARPVSRPQYILAKLCGICLALAAIIGATYIVSALAAVFLPALRLTAAEFFRLLDFYAVSLLYLCFFAFVGLLFSVVAGSESTTLFLPILVWVAAVFILPELTLGSNPVALLNPVTLASAAPDQGQFFTVMRAGLGWLSVGQFYTQSGLNALGAADGGAAALPALFIYNGAVAWAAAAALRRHAGTGALTL
ncbi:MAG: ABC transporter permease subunit [Patescibacteria group bacterium]|nr:ABC transporter permease subunit [Patescibacteria group bacterium]